MKPSVIKVRIRVLLFHCLFYCFFAGYGQSIDFENFSSLRSSGDIPLDFRQQTSSKYRTQMAQADWKTDGVRRKDQKQFLLENNFFLNEVLLSGKVIFNDPVTEYINAVADNLLKSDPVLRQKLRFYTVKSPVVNAFATDQGIIFVNLGLIAQLENEAQLAFVLAHEITHYVKKHNLIQFIERGEIQRGKGKYARQSFDEKIFSYHFRSREMENEADEYGLELFAASEYSFDAIRRIMDVLLYAYLPFDELPFPAKFVFPKHFENPENYMLDELTPVTGAEDYDDSYATHPNIKRRREQMNYIIRQKDETSRNAFLQDKQLFYDIRNLARFECLNQYMIELDYGNALYNTFVVMQDFPDNAFLTRVFAASLYGLSKYRTNGNITRVLSSHRKVEGQSQQVFYMFRQFNPDELNVIALYHCYKAYEKYPGDQYLKGLAEDLLFDLSIIRKLDISQFRRNALVEPDTLAVKEPESKYDRIRLSKLQSKNNEPLFDVFIDLFQETDFEKFVLLTLNNAEKERNYRINNEVLEISAEDKARMRKEREYIRKHGYALGKEKIVIVDPEYYLIDESSGTSLRFLDSEQALEDYKLKIKKIGRKAGMQVNIIDSKNFSVDDIQEFNYHATLGEWTKEWTSHTNIRIVPYTATSVKEIINFYETDVFVWTYVLGSRKRFNIQYGTCMLTVMMPLLFPLLIYDYFDVEVRTSFVFLVVDVNSGDLLMSANQEIKFKDYGDLSKSLIYDVLTQIKNKPSKKRTH